MPKKPKEKVRSARLLLWGALGLSALLAGGAIFGRDGYLAVLVNQQRIETLEAEIATLRQGNRRLRQDVHSLKNDLTSIERIAREDLGLVKPGETVYELLPPGKDR
ncbi:MAG: septum formation initiator family protein [bacterium]|nr:septum formation initiator family protein [bacterium]